MLLDEPVFLGVLRELEVGAVFVCDKREVLGAGGLAGEDVDFGSVFSVRDLEDIGPLRVCATDEVFVQVLGWFNNPAAGGDCECGRFQILADRKRQAGKREQDEEYPYHR